jgi:hypothetical protein
MDIIIVIAISQRTAILVTVQAIAHPPTPRPPGLVYGGDGRTLKRLENKNCQVFSALQRACGHMEDTSLGAGRRGMRKWPERLSSANTVAVVWLRCFTI